MKAWPKIGHKNMQWVDMEDGNFKVGNMHGYGFCV